MRATSSALTGKSSLVRSVWATYAGRPATRTVPTAGWSSLSSARNSVVLPPPLGPSTQTVRPGSTPNDTLAQDGRAAVAGGEVVHEDGGCRHRAAAAPKARTA